MLCTSYFGSVGLVLIGGSALAANHIAVLAVVNTNLSAGISGLTWVLIDYRHTKKFSTFSFCSGAVAGYRSNLLILCNDLVSSLLFQQLDMLHRGQQSSLAFVVL